MNNVNLLWLIGPTALSRLIGSKWPGPDVTLLSGVYCILKFHIGGTFYRFRLTPVNLQSLFASPGDHMNPSVFIKPSPNGTVEVCISVLLIRSVRLNRVHANEVLLYLPFMAYVKFFIQVIFSFRFCLDCYETKMPECTGFSGTSLTSFSKKALIETGLNTTIVYCSPHSLLICFISSSSY